MLLVQAQESSQVLDEEMLAFLADLGILDSKAIQKTIQQNATFQTDDLDAYDFDCDDISLAKAVLPFDNQNAPEILEFFKINEWQARLDANDVSIANLRKHIKSLKGKNVVEKDVRLNNPNVITPGMFKIDLEPLAPKLLNNRDAHIDYIKHSRKHADTLYEIVEHTTTLRPLDSDLDSASHLGTVRFESDQIEKIMGYGDYQMGKVMISRALRAYNEDVGISHQTSVARIPQQNDVVKRRNQTLVEAARTMLIFSKALLFLWAKAVATACYTQNQSLIQKRHNKTPYELLHNKKPDLSYLYVFGSLCYPTNDSEDLGKLKPKADIGIFVGYALANKAFWSYNKRTRLITKTIHVGLVPNPPSPTPYEPPTKKD
nr:retrovirus-related Pol polyprotein from transposon TNT 1-94 [Tanacetum cinerariifolium]